MGRQKGIMKEKLKTIQQELKKHPVVLYMKGDKIQPLCGFSARVVHILNNYGIEFETRNVLEDEVLRAAIKEYSDWPTLPQLFVKEEFIGGCDIVEELHANGELKKILAVF